MLSLQAKLAALPTMPTNFLHLGRYSDLAAAAKPESLWRPAQPGVETRANILRALAFDPRPASPADVRSERTWERDGIVGEEISWSVSYGPRTRAWLLRPAGVTGRLPAVVALFCHSGFYYFGKEKIADGPDATHISVVELRRRIYGDRAFANALAARGFAVLVPDVFLWGSRRFELAEMPESFREPESGDSTDVDRYNDAARAYENVVSKYCTVLGTSFAGVVSYEDRVAVEYLAGRGDIDPARIGCVGLSGGGLRAGLLQGTSDRIAATVIACMMSTYEGLLDHNIANHTWMFFPPGLPHVCDYPDLVASRAPSPLLVQYALDDHLFTLRGMEAADQRLSEAYTSAGMPKGYDGRFYPGGHRFDIKMQDEAFEWLAERLG
jgi:dienelactone hydrolase